MPEKAMVEGDGEIPDNSDMVRMQVFPSGSLPDASQENHGCIVLEEGGPMENVTGCVFVPNEKVNSIGFD